MKNDLKFLQIIPFEDDYKEFVYTIKDIQKDLDKSIKNPDAKLNSLLDKLRGSITRIKQETFIIASICYYLQKTKIYKTKYKTFQECLEKEEIKLSRTTAIDFANIFRFVINNYQLIKQDVLSRLGYRHLKTLSERTKKLSDPMRIKYLKTLSFKTDKDMRDELDKLIK